MSALFLVIGMVGVIGVLAGLGYASGVSRTA